MQKMKAVLFSLNGCNKFYCFWKIKISQVITTVGLNLHAMIAGLRHLTKPVHELSSKH